MEQAAKRGDIGERITSIGWNDNRLIVAREGHGLVPGEEEALEVEVWLAGTLERRFDVKRGSFQSMDHGWVSTWEESCTMAKLYRNYNILFIH